MPMSIVLCIHRYLVLFTLLRILWACGSKRLKSCIVTNGTHFPACIWRSIWIKCTTSLYANMIKFIIMLAEFYHIIGLHGLVLANPYIRCRLLTVTIYAYFQCKSVFIVYYVETMRLFNCIQIRYNITHACCMRQDCWKLYAVQYTVILSAYFENCS